MKKETLYHIFSHFPELETERLILRAMRVSDAASMYDYAKRPEVTKYLLWSSCLFLEVLMTIIHLNPSSELTS